MNVTLHALLEDTSARRGGCVAVEDPVRELSITYADLDAWASAIADSLTSLGVRAGDRVGLWCGKSIGSVAAIYGTLKAGAAYVPVDASAPVERAADMLEDCGVRALVATPELVAALPVATGRSITPLPVAPARVSLLAEGLVLAVGPRPSPPTREDIAYVLYTSGSTGRPKGVVHTHASARSFVDWCSGVFAPSEADRFSSHAPFHFDLSVFDLFVSAKHGATLVLIDDELQRAPAHLARVIAERRVSVWYSTPSVLRYLLEFGAVTEHDWSALRLVIFAGEVFPPRHFRRLRSAWPRPRYFNLFGPTETNVCTYYELPARLDADGEAPIPIGRACENDRERVVDEAGRDVRPGLPGELMVSGGSVMLAYWNRLQDTERAFHVEADGVRWYRTGDIVRRDLDGNYHFLGRRDRMVKRRGYRVELGEIELILGRHPSIGEAGALAVASQDGDVMVRAFVSCAPAERPPSLIELKRWCADHLPRYMIPDRITTLGALPKTSTHKLDYEAMARLD